MRALVPVLLLLSVGLAPACRSVTPPGTYFDTLPPGAEVVIDGRGSGYVTPCLISLDEEESYDVRLELVGYEPRELVLRSADRTDRVPWSDGAPAPNGTHLVFGLEFKDLFVPFRHDEAHSPSRIFVRLRPTAGPGPGEPAIPGALN